MDRQDVQDDTFRRLTAQDEMMLESPHGSPSVKKVRKNLKIVFARSAEKFPLAARSFGHSSSSDIFRRIGRGLTTDRQRRIAGQSLNRTSCRKIPL